MTSIECPPEYQGRGLKEYLGCDFARVGGEEPPLLVAQKVVEGKAPLLRHQDSLAYLGVDDELLLGITQVECFLEYLRSGLVLLQHNFGRAALYDYPSRTIDPPSSHQVRNELRRDDKCSVVVPTRPRYLRNV